MEDKRARAMGNGKNENILSPITGTSEAHGRNMLVLTRLQDLAETLLLFQYS